MFYIKEMRINGFRKFQNTNIRFNDKMNIIVGDNESGKSTVLEAIDILINQRIRNYDKSILRELFNKSNIDKFLEQPNNENLPSIYLEITLDTNRSNVPEMMHYYGSNNQLNVESYGIRFECKLDDNYKEDLKEYISSGKIPYEYYSFSWLTFADATPSLYKKEIRTLFIDNSTRNGNNSFNYYMKDYLNSTYDTNELLEIKHEFNEVLKDHFADEKFEITEETKLGINHKRVNFENMSSITQNGIHIENMGKGRENLIKTQVALKQGDAKASVILIEEPENHLSTTTMFSMLKIINDEKENKQIIITTHNDSIASNLGLHNVIWLKSEEESISLTTLGQDTVNYFAKLDNNNFLKFLLSKKILLVEGATENLIVPYLYKKSFSSTLEEDNITIISAGGLSYGRYIELARITQSKIVVITDNDGDSTFAKNHRSENTEKVSKFSDECHENFTFEVSLYECNEELIKELVVEQHLKPSF